MVPRAGREIDDSPAYREAAADWEGDIAFVVEADPERGVPDDVWGHLDLWHGACRSGTVVTPERGDDAAFVISATYPPLEGRRARRPRSRCGR